MTHGDTRYAWCIHTGKPVHIGKRREWTSQKTDKRGRPEWVPKEGTNTDPEKADRGRNHYCCQERHIAMIVVQGTLNAWCFRPNMLVDRVWNLCGLQEMIREFQSAPEGEKHKQAKDILANFLNSDTGKDEFNIQEVIVEKEIPRVSPGVIPDIRLEHSDGRLDSYVEIVDTSAPHQNSNAWEFYKDKLDQLITIDIKDNEKGWNYDKASIQELLLDRFRRRFEDHINTPKIWDDVSAAITEYGKLREEQHLKDTQKQKEMPKLNWEEMLATAREEFDEYWEVDTIKSRYESQTPLKKAFLLIGLRTNLPVHITKDMVEVMESDTRESRVEELNLELNRWWGRWSRDTDRQLEKYVNEQVESLKESTQERLFEDYPISANIYNSEEMGGLVELSLEGQKLGYSTDQLFRNPAIQAKIFGSIESFEYSVNELWKEVNDMVDELADEGVDVHMLSGGWGLPGDFEPSEIKKKKEELWSDKEQELQGKYERYMQNYRRHHGYNGDSTEGLGTRRRRNG